MSVGECVYGRIWGELVQQRNSIGISDNTQGVGGQGFLTTQSFHREKRTR